MVAVTLNIYVFPCSTPDAVLETVSFEPVTDNPPHDFTSFPLLSVSVTVQSEMLVVPVAPLISTKQLALFK